MKPELDFHPSEILCLEYEATFLYSEVIQTVPHRNLCWVRPLVLTIPSAIALDTSPIDAATTTEADSTKLYDLRHGADLLCPSCLFRAALDTEVIPLLVQLEEAKTYPEVDHIARRELQAFIQRVWQAHPEAFAL